MYVEISKNDESFSIKKLIIKLEKKEVVIKKTNQIIFINQQ